MHEVDARDALGERVAQQARGPDDALPVGVDQLAAGDDLTQPIVLLHRDELRRVDRHVLRVAARGDRVLDGGQRVLHVEPVDGAAQDVGARAHATAAVVARRDGGERVDERVGSALRGVPVPQRDDAGRRRPAGEAHLAQARRVVAQQHVRPMADRHRPLGVGAQRVARDAERRRLLLDAARVGDDRAGAGLERQEVEVADRLRAADAGGLEPLERGAVRQPGAGPRVDREHDRRVGPERGERVDDPGELRRLVDVRRAVERHEHVAALVDAVPAPHRAVAGGVLEPPQRVDHRVADVADARRVDALVREVLFRLGAVRQQQVGEPVGEHPVDLLGHGPVARAEPRLEVGDGDAELRRRERAGDRGVHVTGHDHESRALVEQDALERHQHLGGLLAVGAGADAERVIGSREPEIVEDLLRHPAVVVLARVDHELPRVAAPVQRGDQRRHLHEVGPRAHDMQHRGGQGGGA